MLHYVLTATFVANRIPDPANRLERIKTQQARTSPRLTPESDKYLISSERNFDRFTCVTVITSHSLAWGTEIADGVRLEIQFCVVVYVKPRKNKLYIRATLRRAEKKRPSVYGAAAEPSNSLAGI